MYRFFLVLLTIALGAGPMAASADSINLLLNGSFEETASSPSPLGGTKIDYLGWTVDDNGGNVGIVSAGVNDSPATAHTGTHMLRIVDKEEQSVPWLWAIQNVDVDPGTYTFSWWEAGPTPYLEVEGTLMPYEGAYLAFYGYGNYEYHYVTREQDWTQYSVTFDVTTTQSMQFSFRDCNWVSVYTNAAGCHQGSVFIDDVSLVKLSAVPLPAALPLMLSGLGLLGFRMHRRNGSRQA